MTRLLSIDPGKRALAWAYFQGDNLDQVGLLRAADTYAMVKRVWTLSALEPGIVLVERPQVYVQSRWRGDPNDLIDIAIICGAVLGVFPDADHSMVQPSKWKGQVPKAIHLERTSRLLTEAERRIVSACDAPKGLMHNVTDAVGLGLWHLKR